MSDITFTKLSWQDLQHDCLKLYTKLDGIQIDHIISITRGGDVVARIFSDLLGNIQISHITLSSYKDMKKQKAPDILEIPQTNFAGKSILIIDEVSDTGATFVKAMEYFEKLGCKEIKTLSPYIKSHTVFTPDYWLKNIDSWIVFPYDVRETADGFMKMFESAEHARDKMLEIGFESWEINAVIKP